MGLRGGEEGYGSQQCGTARSADMALAVHLPDAILQCCPSPPSPPSPDCSVPWNTQVLMTGHSRAPAAQLLHGAAEVLVLHHIPTLLCSFLRETVLLLALRGENEPHPKFPAYTKNKNEKLLHGWAQGWPVGRKGLSPRKNLGLRALQLVKHFHPL